MLVNLTISNFRTFGEEILFSTEIFNKRNKSKDYVIATEFKDYNYLMNVVGIFGANASGKTTIFLALDLLKLLIKKSHSFEKEKKINCEIFKLSSKFIKQPSKISIEFIENETLYSYYFSIFKNEILEEILYKKKKNKRKIVLLDREKKNNS